MSTSSVTSIAKLDNGLTMVIVTHDSTIARRAQRVGTMRNGQLTVRQAV
jgi:predicted ABC-type transport system involved in lysophospholipase L1 biosynthesis ATPase subunit